MTKPKSAKYLARLQREASKPETKKERPWSSELDRLAHENEDLRDQLQSIYREKERLEKELTIAHLEIQFLQDERARKAQRWNGVMQ